MLQGGGRSLLEELRGSVAQGGRGMLSQIAISQRAAAVCSRSRAAGEEQGQEGLGQPVLWVCAKASKLFPAWFCQSN